MAVVRDLKRPMDVMEITPEKVGGGNSSMGVDNGRKYSVAGGMWCMEGSVVVISVVVV